MGKGKGEKEKRGKRAEELEKRQRAGAIQDAIAKFEDHQEYAAPTALAEKVNAKPPRCSAVKGNSPCRRPALHYYCSELLGRSNSNTDLNR
jgi:hypothetical protein